MMEVKLKYTGIFQDMTGRQKETVKLEEPTIKELVNVLGKRYGAEFRNIFIDPEDDRFKRGMMILVNGTSKDLEYSLKQGEEVVFAAALAGG